MRTAKLNEADVRAIRDMHTRDGMSATESARARGVGKTTVAHVPNGETWAHLAA